MSVTHPASLVEVGPAMQHHTSPHRNCSSLPALKNPHKLSKVKHYHCTMVAKDIKPPALEEHCPSGRSWGGTTVPHAPQKNPSWQGRRFWAELESWALSLRKSKNNSKRGAENLGHDNTGICLGLHNRLWCCLLTYACLGLIPPDTSCIYLT